MLLRTNTSVVPQVVMPALQLATDDVFADLVAIENIPAQLKTIPNWVSWKIVNNSKVPFICGTDRHASSTDSSTWSDFKTATADVKLSESEGIGFVIHGAATEAGIIGVDLDGCRNPETGALTEWAKTIVDSLQSYTEITPSKAGIRVWVIGKLPEAKHVFNLSPKAGYGSKVKIEIFDRARYFTVTGDRKSKDSVIQSRDLSTLFELCEQIKQQFPIAKSESPAVAESRQDVQGVQIEHTGTAITDKLTLLMKGKIVSTKPSFIVADDYGNSAEYNSQSEADLSLCTMLAFAGYDEAGIDTEFRNSPLYRDKWERKDYRETTIQKALKTASAKTEAIVLTATDQQPVDDTDEDAIPPFDPSVVNGIYAKIVELARRGTTLDPQFVFVIAKTIVGARMAGKVKFADLDVEPRYYTALIGETGSGKGEAWRRVRKILEPEGSMISCQMKIIDSFDSGAGLRDLFFETPENQPVLCYVDEVESFGNKAAATRNPAILDTLIELADSTSISRTIAKRNGGGSKRKNDARLCAVLCGQEGSIYAKAFAGRAKLGLWDRLYPEFAVPVKAGDLPPIDPLEAVKLLDELNSLDYSGTMSMNADAKARLNSFWESQPIEIQRKARFKKFLCLDAYMSAFGRKLKTVELSDAEIAINIFNRQIIIRQKHFTNEVPDRVGYYLGVIKKITEKMRQQLAAGIPQEAVARSRRDYEATTNASRLNEEHIFAKAWDVHSKVHLMRVIVKRSNGQTYEKCLPVPNDDPQST